MDSTHAAAQSDRNGNPWLRRPWQLPPRTKRSLVLGRTGCRADRFVVATIEANTTAELMEQLLALEGAVDAET